MEYQDFEIDIRSAEESKFEARVVNAPFQDRPQSFFSPPLEQPTLDAYISSVDGRIRADDGEATSDAGTAPKPSPREIGRLLWNTLFLGELGELFLRCRAGLPARKKVGLRVRLSFRLDDPQADYLAALPWELLCDPKTGQYLARDIRTPVTRRLLNPHHHVNLDDVTGPLRILVVDAAPATMKKLNLMVEIERMEKSLSKLETAGEVELVRLAEATPESLREMLRDEVIHVFHFMGHGGYDEGSKMGSIYFASSERGKDMVDGEMLGALFKSIPDLRLVVLNACKTARHAGNARAPLYLGAASGLIERTGMPAVVANQHSISDQAAIAFSETFYRRLAARDPVDTAISEARLQLSWRSREWATPVLFLSAAHGRIFGKKTRRKKAGPSRVAPVTAERLHLGVLSFDGWGKEMRDVSDDLCDLTPYFDPSSPDGRFIQDPSWWQERVFPDLRVFLANGAHESRPVLLDFAAHQSIAFAAGWLLEAKSGLDVAVRQRTLGRVCEWHPSDGSTPSGELWQERPVVELDSRGPDVAVVVTVSNLEVVPQVRDFIKRAGLPVGRIIDATIKEPGQGSVKGGAHCLRLAQALVHQARERRPHERGGRLHLFGSAPNALLFYLGQLSRSLGSVVLYEYAFNVQENYGRYQRSFELPPPGEAAKLPQGW